MVRHRYFLFVDRGTGEGAAEVPLIELDSGGASAVMSAVMVAN